jgi:pyrimidine-nucleoside phosphorylase
MTVERDALTHAIERKRGGHANTRAELEQLVQAYAGGIVNDVEFTRWLHAVMEHGLTTEETAFLTQAMAASGAQVRWHDVEGVIVDKHSTGGVGDAVSLIAVPLAASCGVKVAKLSGRALGHTGGTIDKLERIPGLGTDLSIAGFKTQVAEVGCAIAQASAELAPADKKIYSLRHRTGTIDSVGLITASVLSKKVAGGAPHLVIDVKCGHCAFMRDEARALALAHSIAEVGRRLGRAVTVLVTDMEEPLARSIGNALELHDALDVLAGRDRSSRLREVGLAVAEAMLSVHAGDERSGAAERMMRLEKALADGTALRRFAVMATARGGDLKALPVIGSPAATVGAPESGFLTWIDGRALGEAVVKREAARPGATIGIRLRKRIGDRVTEGEPLADVYGDATLVELVRSAVMLHPAVPRMRPAVLHRIHAEPDLRKPAHRSS